MHVIANVEFAQFIIIILCTSSVALWPFLFPYKSIRNVGQCHFAECRDTWQDDNVAVVIEDGVA